MSYPSKVKGWEEAERKYDVQARLAQLGDWDGFDDNQKACRSQCREWLKKNCGMNDDQLQKATPVIYCDLPQTAKDGSFSKEACYIGEREVFWNLTDLAEGYLKNEQVRNREWCQGHRKQIYHDATGSSDADPDNKPYGWDKKNRRQRYDYLCIATKHGSTYDDWAKTHDTKTGKAKPPPPSADTRHKLSEHFIVEEFDCHDGTKVKSQWYDGLEYLCKTFLEPLRDKYGSVHVNSGYRDASYNAGIGGASNSYHVYDYHANDDQASDIVCATGNPSQWRDFLSSIRSSKCCGNGGLGLYSTFVHVDTRNYQSNWTG